MFSIRKLLGASVSTALLSAATVTVVTAAAPAPAHADVTAQSAVVSGLAPRLVGTFDDYLSLSGGEVQVRYPDGTVDSPSAGSAILQRLAPGSSTWQNVGTDTSPGYLYFPNVDRFTGNARYRIYYTGGTYSDYDYGTVTAPPAVSAATQVITLLDPSVKGVTRSGRLFAAFTVAPKAKYKVLVQIKRSGKWRRYARTTTNTRGKAQVRITSTSRKGVPYRAIFAGGSRFATTKITFRGIRY